MRIDSVKAAFPSRVMNNDDIVSLVRQHSEGSFEGDLEQTLAQIKKWLDASGAKARRWMNEGEVPIDLIEEAVDAALADAGIGRQDVDLLIYVGVGKGFLEPGQSYMVAHALGMDRVECFDILDACMSWTRGMLVAESLFRTGRYRRIMVVNGELNMYEGGFGVPANFRLKNAEQLEWTFATYTIGNAATATILSADSESPWVFRFSSRPDLADLCTIPGSGYALFSNGAEKIGKNGAHLFTSFGRDLHMNARAPAVALMREILGMHGDVRLIFPHASSFKEWDRFARDLGVEDKVHHIYPEHGNLVSASVPAGIATAIEKGTVRRGDRLAGWVGSAGMSFSAYTFVY